MLKPRYHQQVHKIPGQDWGLRQAQDWEFKLCWLPKKCYLTRKLLWGQQAYHGKWVITGPGDPVVEHYWIKKDQFIMWRLKGAK